MCKVRSTSQSGFENRRALPSFLCTGSDGAIRQTRRRNPERRRFLGRQALDRDGRFRSRLSERRECTRKLDYRQARRQVDDCVSCWRQGLQFGLCCVGGVPLRTARNGVSLPLLYSSGESANWGLRAYVASKWAVRGLSLTAAAEFAQYGAFLSLAVALCECTNTLRRHSSERHSAWSYSDSNVHLSLPTHSSTLILFAGSPSSPKSSRPL